MHGWGGSRGETEFERGMCQAEQPIINMVNTVFIETGGKY